MKAGQLDRRVTILRPVAGAVDALNAPVVAYQPLCTVWAQRLDTRAYERTTSDKRHAVREATFRMRFRDLEPTDRLLCEGLVYDVTGITELGRRAGLEITAEARD